MRPRSGVALVALLAVLALTRLAATGPAGGAAIVRPDSGARLPALGLRVEAAVRDTEPAETVLPAPRASYRSFAAARERLREIVRRTLGACADSARWTRGPLEFRYRDQPVLLHALDGHSFWTIEARDTAARVFGDHLTFRTVRDDCPGERELVAALANAGWVEDPHYEADGPDGTTFAFFCREALCAVDLSWDGGDDSDSTYVPKPGYWLELVCVPRPAPRSGPGGAGR